MTEIPTYALTQDSRRLFERVNNGRALPEAFLRACDQYFSSLQETIAQGFPDVVVRGYSESEINQRLSQRIRSELTNRPNTYCICLDRYLIPEIETEFADRFFRFSITRTTDGRKCPRSGDPTFSEQIQELTKAIPDIGTKQAIIVDDGIFSGGTVQDVCNLFKLSKEQIQVQSIIGFIGSIAKKNSAQILEPIDDLYEWVDIRDFSPLAGKTVATSRNNRVASASPYLYPWNLGEGASFTTSPKLFQMSRVIIQAFQTLVRSFEQQNNRTLRFRELVKTGFTLPIATNKNLLPVSINDRVFDYLELCLQKIDYEQNRAVMIFDMDGTLYRLDGKDGGYTGSTLEKKVMENAINFIMAKDSCSLLEAEKIYSTGVADPIGLSAYLSSRYGITRSEYFDIVWNIDPVSIVGQYEISVQTLKKLKLTNTKLVLLTSAPGVWMKRVLKTLCIEDVFELTYSGEQFGTKNEIFNRLAQWYAPSNIISIGDQEKTDIIPAQTLGLRTLLVTSPAEVMNIQTYI